MRDGEREPELFYEFFADDFDTKMNRYDLETRLSIVFESLLPSDIRGLKLLDVGCGTGHFSRMAREKKARVVSMDVGMGLLQKVAEKCNSNAVVGSVLGLPFKRNSFDLVICSEVIEHTRDPFKSVEELYRILKPRGISALTVPNRFWKWSCILANFLGLRPYRGLENWVGYKTLRKKLEFIGFKVNKYFGFHLFPFQVTPLQSLLRRLDQFGYKLGAFNINIGACCEK